MLDLWSCLVQSALVGSVLVYSIALLWIYRKKMSNEAQIGRIIRVPVSSDVEQRHCIYTIYFSREKCRTKRTGENLQNQFF